MKVEFSSVDSYIVKAVKFFILILFIVFNASIVSAQDNALIEAESMVDTSTITIGDRIKYSIIIDRAEGLRIEKPGEGLNLGMFEIKDYIFHEPEEKDGRIIERYDFTISVYDTGRFTIPAFPIAYFPEDTGYVFKIIEAPSIDIFVQSVLAGEEAKELKDIKPPIYIPFNYMFWISIAAVIILAGAIGFLGYRLWKRHKEKGYIFTPPPPPKPAHEIALAALEELYQNDLLEKGAYKEFFSRLSQIVRAYLEGRYFILALEETTSEIMRDIYDHIKEQNLLKDLENILTLSDLVKFAKYIPETDEINQAKQEALDFVNNTKVVYEIEEESGQQSVHSDQPLVTDGIESCDEAVPPGKVSCNSPPKSPSL